MFKCIVIVIMVCFVLKCISFPSSTFNIAVRYAIHEQLLPMFNLEDNIEEQADDNDEN
jgi:hypothetical protein